MYNIWNCRSTDSRRHDVAGTRLMLRSRSSSSVPQTNEEPPAEAVDSGPIRDGFRSRSPPCQPEELGDEPNQPSFTFVNAGITMSCNGRCRTIEARHLSAFRLGTIGHNARIPRSDYQAVLSDRRVDSGDQRIVHLHL
jgi:hypothetical protein